MLEMPSPIFGFTILASIISILGVIIYLAALLALAWESHNRYGTGYYWVGANLAGVVGSIFNYRYWQAFQAVGSDDYPLIAMILINFLLCFIGLWSYLIYFAIMLKREKHYRAGTRMENRIFAAEQAATGTGRFREFLQGWEGDMKLDALIVEGKFSEAEDYLEGVILASAAERDLTKARYYEQYRKVIMRERLFFEESKEFRSVETAGQESGDQGKDISEPEFGRAKELKQEDLPEGWQLPE